MLFDQSLEAMFETQPFTPIEELKLQDSRPKTVSASEADHFDMPQPFETAPTNSPVAAVDDLWAKVPPEEDEAVAKFLESVAAEIDGKIEQNSEYLTFLSFSHEVLLVFSRKGAYSWETFL